MLINRPEFHLADLAAMTLGATPFSIYATSTPEQIAYVVGDAGARVAIVEAAFVDAFQAARTELTGLEHLIVLEGERARARWPGTPSRAPTPASTPRRAGARSARTTCSR